MVFVFKPSENVKKKIIEYYDNLKKDSHPPYSVFQAMDADTTVTLYESGKVMFQGISADVDVNIWAAMERKLNNRDVLNEDKKKDKDKTKKDDTTTNYEYLKHISTVGSDEVGTGDYFGPIIVTATYVSKENISKLEELKIGDSKKMTDDKIKEVAPIIMKFIPYSTLSLSNIEFNNIKDYNMNKIKTILHNKVLLSILQKDNVKPEKVVVDQFTTPRSYYSYINDSSNVCKNITFLTKAEDKVYSVAAASVISRYLFLAKMKEMEDELNKIIPLGANSQVDDFAKELVKEFGEEILDKYTKKSFKNTQKVLETI